MLTSTIPVWWIDPPDFSDGMSDTYPISTFDEDFIRSKYLTFEFRNHLWKTYYDSSNGSSFGNCGSMEDELWRNGITEFSIGLDGSNSSADLKDPAKPLKVEFYVPLDVNTTRYHTFLLLVGQELRNILLEEGHLKLITKIHVGNSYSPPNSPSFPLRPSSSLSPPSDSPNSNDDDDDEQNIDIETVSDDYSFQAEIITKKKKSVTQVSSFLTPRQSLSIDTTVACILEEQEIGSLSALISNDDYLKVSSSSFFKMSCLPQRYRLYEKFIIEYPPPPLIACNAGIQKSSDLNNKIPKIKVSRSFSVFGHPSGKEFDRSSFAQHLSWLYKISSDVNNISDPLISANEINSIAAPGCNCENCPYSTSYTTRYRPGELVWISTSALVQQGLLIDIFSFIYHDMGIFYWPAQMCSNFIHESHQIYQAEPILFPSFTMRSKRRIIDVQDDIHQSILPFTQYRPSNLTYLRKVYNLKFLPSSIAKCFVIAYEKAIRASHEFYPVLSDISGNSEMLLFGSEMLHSGDWVQIDSDCHLVRHLSLSPTRSSRLRKKTWLMKVDEINWITKNKNIYTPSLDSHVEIRGNIYNRTVENQIILEIADASVLLNDILGRVYTNFPEVTFPLSVQILKTSLSLQSYIPKHFSETTDPTKSLADSKEEYLMSLMMFNGNVITHSHAFICSLRKLRCFLARAQRKSSDLMLKDYMQATVDRIPNLHCITSEQTNPIQEELEAERKESVETSELPQKRPKKKRGELEILLDDIKPPSTTLEVLLTRQRRNSMISKQSTIDILSDISSSVSDLRLSQSEDDEPLAMKLEETRRAEEIPVRNQPTRRSKRAKIV